MRLIWNLIALFAAVCYGEQFKPSVSLVSGSKDSFNLQAFDDSTTLLRSADQKISISRDNGVTWETIKGLNGAMAFVDPNHSRTRAFATSFKHRGTFEYTDDMGQSWQKFSIPLPPGKTFDQGNCFVRSHPLDKNYLMVRCLLCGEGDKVHDCSPYIYLSDDCGKHFRIVDDNSEGYTFCEYGLGKSVICLMAQDTDQGRKSRLFHTEDFGRSFHDFEELKETGVLSFHVLDSYVVAFTAEDRFNEDSNRYIWISTEGQPFKKAHLPTQVRSDAFRMVEDSSGRIFLPVTVPGSKRVTEVLVSDSSGLKFTVVPWSADNVNGFTYFYHFKYLKGTIIGQFMGYKVDNQKEAQTETKISFDSGSSWENMKVVDPDNKDKYPCDIDDYENCFLSLSPIFGETLSDPTPGIIMAMGSVTDGSGWDYEHVSLFITTDGGHSWRMTFDFPGAYAYGDYGNVIVVCPFDSEEDGDLRSEFYYSLDHGESWTEYQLEKTFFPLELMSTTPDGSGVTFILEGMRHGGLMKKPESYLYTIDFSGAFDGRKCDESDMEEFLVAEGECVNGAKYKFNRRKANAQCLIRQTFVDLEENEESCVECTDKDYECAFEFTENSDNKCELNYELLSLSEICQNDAQSSVELEPLSLKKNNKCVRKKDITPVKAQCGAIPDSQSKASEISVTENHFDSNIISYQYFDRMSDESLLIGTIKSDIYISHDSGKTVKKLDTNDNIVEVVFNPYFNSSAYLFGTSGTLYITRDGGYSFSETQLPRSRQLGFPLEFSAKDENTFIYYGGKDCDSMFNPECHAVAFITTDGGESFHELLDNAIHCEFVGSLYSHPSDEKLIFCQVKEKNSAKRTLVSSTDFFVKDKNEIFDSIIGYMSTGEFTVVAIPHEDGELRAYVTVDGKEFAEAKFPQDAVAEKQEAFTILGSQTGSIFLHLSTNNRPGGEFGALMKSNSNGTSFVTLERAVNRNRLGMVDFEKVQGLEGIILVNIVGNRDGVLNEGAAKKLKSKITFNDGSDWSFISPPKEDSEGKSYSCGKSLEKCSLHLHSYSERTDVRDTFSSGSAVGMLIGVGNVGEFLLPKEECSTFFSSDGGETWTEIKKGAYQWEYGDHGGVLVLVAESVPTNTLTFSTDAGKSWKDFEFADEKVIIQDIITVPGDSVLRFLLISQATSVKGGDTRTFSIDFTGSFARQCTFNPNDPANDDFDYLPLGEFGSKCLFGHQAEYLKKINNDCYVGFVPVSKFNRITKNCSCTRQDFECDYNFQKANDGTCKLVEGLTPESPSDICKKSEAVEYFQPSGYRKIPLSTCEGGLKLDTASDPQPCPGKEAEFKEKYNVKGFPFFTLFFVPFIIVALTAWFVYVRGIRRNGGFARFGEIRLGDDTLIENNGTDKAVNFLVRSGLYALSGLYSGYQLAKRSATNAIVKISEKFGRRTGPTYSSLLHDQFLEDADDLLEGHDEDANDLGSFLENEGNFEIDDDENPTGAAQHQPYSDDINLPGEGDSTAATNQES